MAFETVVNIYFEQKSNFAKFYWEWRMGYFHSLSWTLLKKKAFSKQYKLFLIYK